MVGSRRFEGRVVLVTGAGQGIGRETANRFAAEGAHVAAVDLNFPAAEATAAEIGAAGGTAIAVRGDVTSPEDAERFVGEVTARLGSIAVLVNNAGGGALVSMDGPYEDWKRQIDLNLNSAVIVSKAVWPGMVERGGGVILNASSIAARITLSGIAAYSAAKAGIVMLTKTIAAEGGAHGIRANCVVPGNVLTPALQAYFDSTDDPTAALVDAVAVTAVGRIGRPEDIAAAYLFLASDEAAWITGTDLLIDGGQSLGQR